MSVPNVMVILPKVKTFRPNPHANQLAVEEEKSESVRFIPWAQSMSEPNFMTFSSC